MLFYVQTYQQTIYMMLCFWPSMFATNMLMDLLRNTNQHCGLMKISVILGQFTQSKSNRVLHVMQFMKCSFYWQTTQQQHMRNVLRHHSLNVKANGTKQEATESDFTANKAAAKYHSAEVCIEC